jgi:hypothetical protein
MATKKHRKYAFVPKLLVRTVIAGVVPACALAAADGCGGTTTTTGSSKDAGHVTDSGSGADIGFTVAAVAYPAYESGVPETGTHDTGGNDASTGPDVFGVAAVAYPAYEAGPG